MTFKCVKTRYPLWLALVAGAVLSCASHPQTEGEESLAVSQQLVARVNSANLELQELTNSCGANQAQQFFQIINKGSSSVKVSDIQIKFWVNDTSSEGLVAGFVNTPGCVINAGNPSCVHPVPAAKATITATKISPACGADAAHQANWEIAIASTDSYAIAPGGMWNNIQAALHLSNYGNFKPGSGTWFSPCMSGSNYTNDSHFAVYYQGNLVYSSGLNAPTCRAPRGTQVLTGFVPSTLATTPLVGRMPPSTQLQIEVGLPLRNPAGLKDFLNQVSDPASAQFRQYRTLAQFQTDHSPTAEQYQQLIAWAQANSLTVVNDFPSRMLLGLRGTAEAIERALFVNLNYYLRPNGTQFFAPDRDPSLNLDVPVLTISGLQNYVVPKPLSLDPNGTGPKSNYLAKDIRNAYAKCTSLTGTGQRLGIFLNATGANMLDYIGYDVAGLGKDVQAYLNLSSLTSTTTISPCNVTGGDGACNPTLPSTNVERTASTVYSELTLDVEMALAMAPGLDEIVIFEGGGLNSALQVLAHRTPVINQFSISYDLGMMHEANAAQALQLLAYKGQSVFNSSGDTGPLQVDNPFAEDKSLDLAYTAVGGTELQLDSTQSAYKVETTWWNPTDSASKPGTTGGVILYHALPSYQTSLPTPTSGSSTKRNFPDVSLLARKVVTVFGVTDPANTTGKVYSSGGTSAAAPLWAAFTALANQSNAASSLGTVGFANPLIYSIGQSATYNTYFHDINDGSTTGAAKNYAVLTASTGYDLATGWGTPKCELINHLNSHYQSLPELTVGATGTASGGPYVCITGSNFTPGGTVTVQYVGAPESPSSPKVITSTQGVNAGGGFSLQDDEKLFVAQALAAGVPGCTPAFIADGVVTVSVVDNATGQVATMPMPGRFWCAINQTTPLGAGCSRPSVTITYNQYGACTYVPTSLGNATPGPYAAYAAFEVPRISNPTGQTFHFDPKKVYVQQGSLRTYSDPNLMIYSQIFGPFAIDSGTFNPGESVNYSPEAHLAVVVSTTTSDGSDEANKTSYLLNYDAPASEPDVVMVKTNASQSSWPHTPNCCDIGPAVCM